MQNLIDKFISWCAWCGDGVSDHVLQEDLEHAAGLLVDQVEDPLDATSPGQAADGGLGDVLGHIVVIVVSKRVDIYLMLSQMSLM